MGKTAKLQYALRAATWVAALLLCLPAGHALADAPDPLLKAPPAQAQRHALIATVDQMDRDNAAGGDVYFVGFAGFGEQKVFRTEAELARRVFGARSLIPGRDGVETQPRRVAFVRVTHAGSIRSRAIVQRASTCGRGVTPIPGPVGTAIRPEPMHET